MESLNDFLIQKFGEDGVLVDEPMSSYTSFKTGGKADFIVSPDDSKIDELKELIQYAKENNINVIFLGNGSNTLVTDKGIRGVVVLLKNLNHIVFDDDKIHVGAGMSIAKLSKVFADNSYIGLEFACGIPGTVGGAVFMNAGAYGGEMKDLVIDVDYLDIRNMDVKKITNDEAKFGYRTSVFQNDLQGSIILGCTMKLIKGDKEEIDAKMQENMTSRNAKQPVTLPSAGSTFRREEGIVVAKLIDEAGLKGCRIGGAEVSTLHAGFIVNVDHATSQDILDLIEHVKKVVKEKYNVELHEEVRIIGER